MPPRVTIVTRLDGGHAGRALIGVKAVATWLNDMGYRTRRGDSRTRRRKAWLSSIVDRIEVDAGAIRMFGRNDVLDQCALAAVGGNAGVRTFVPKWRAMQDESTNTYAIEVTL